MKSNYDQVIIFTGNNINLLLHPFIDLFLYSQPLLTKSSLCEKNENAQLSHPADFSCTHGVNISWAGHALLHWSHRRVLTVLEQICRNKRNVPSSDHCAGRNLTAKSAVLGDAPIHTPSIAFGHLPPNSARTGYATKGALFISTQLSTDAVSALWKVWVLVRMRRPERALKHARKHVAHPIIIKMKVFLMHKILSLETILSAFTHAHTHTHTHMDRGTRTHKHSDLTKLKYTQLETGSKRSGDLEWMKTAAWNRKHGRSTSLGKEMLLD